MSEQTYVEKLRAIRDQIGQELERTSWDQWEKQAREEVRRHPRLAAMLDEAVEPSAVRPAPRPV